MENAWVTWLEHVMCVGLVRVRNAGVFFFNLCMLRASKSSKYFYLWSWPCCKESAMNGVLVGHDGAAGGFLSLLFFLL